MGIGTVGLRSRCPAPKLKENTELQLQSIQIFVGDSRDLYQFNNSADRVAGCTLPGLGTLHRHADALAANNRVCPGTFCSTGAITNIRLGQPGGVLVYKHLYATSL